jgi:hypothetical protein
MRNMKVGMEYELQSLPLLRALQVERDGSVDLEFKSLQSLSLFRAFQEVG